MRSAYTEYIAVVDDNVCSNKRTMKFDARTKGKWGDIITRTTHRRVAQITMFKHKQQATNPQLSQNTQLPPTTML